MKIINKKEVRNKDIDYLVDICKYKYFTNNSRTYYTYDINIYDTKLNTGIKGLLYKHNKLYHYTTDWKDYFDYKGDLTRVLKRAFMSFDYNIRREQLEQQSIEAMENTKLGI